MLGLGVPFHPRPGGRSDVTHGPRRRLTCPSARAEQKRLGENKRVERRSVAETSLLFVHSVTLVHPKPAEQD